MSIKISELPAATALTGTESFPVVQAGETRKATITDLAASGYPSNLISSPLTVPADTSYIVVGYLSVSSDLTIRGNIGVL